MPLRLTPAFLLLPRRTATWFAPLRASTAHRASAVRAFAGDAERPGGLIAPSLPSSSPQKRIRCISCDVTGTLVSFIGRLEDHYANAARTCGLAVRPEDKSKFPSSFNRAYRETSASHPCFGNNVMSSKEWWSLCVKRSFELAGMELTSSQQEMVFQRVYSTFGSHAAYGAFPDAVPFLRWCRRRGVVCGIISNADERYGDSILPMLGLVDDLQFLCFSKNVGAEKPDQRIFEAAVREAEPWLSLDDTTSTVESSGRKEMLRLIPSEILHIGNDFQKDYVGAKEAGFHSVLLDRYGENELVEKWRKGGAPVFKDLIDVVEYLGNEQFQLGSKGE